MYMFFEGGDEVEPADVSWIASVHEGGGIQIILNVSYGEIIEDHIRCQQLGPLEVEPFFADLKESYRSLKLIECEGRVTMAVDEMIQERCNIACEEDTCAQTQHWGAGFDICISADLQATYMA